MAAAQQGAEQQAQPCRELLAATRPTGDRSSFSFSDSLNPENKSKLRSSGHPADFKGVGSEQWGGLSFDPFGLPGAEDCLPSGGICQKSGDFYQGAQAAFNLKPPRAGIREGKGGQREATVISWCPQERSLPPSLSASFLKPISAEFKGISEL